MNYLPEDLVFAFGLLFRILFYTLLISLMFFEKVRVFKSRYNKWINIALLFFAGCYIGSLIPLFFDDKNYGGSSEFLMTVWSLFFIYILVFNNAPKRKFALHKTTSYIVVRVIIIVILFCNAQLNYHSYKGTWYGDYNSEAFHGILSFLLPVTAYLFSVIKPKSINLGLFIILVSMLQFVYGISLSYGVDGYISDDIELSIIFILNTVLFFGVGLYNIKTQSKYNEKQ
nr:hypothetical protein [uncultured Psychroserpens sp.]